MNSLILILKVLLLNGTKEKHNIIEYRDRQSRTLKARVNFMICGIMIIFSNVYFIARGKLVIANHL